MNNIPSTLILKIRHKAKEERTVSPVIVYGYLWLYVHDNIYRLTHMLSTPEGILSKHYFTIIKSSFWQQLISDAGVLKLNNTIGSSQMIKLLQNQLKQN